MLNPLVSLAFGLHRSPGVYALLLGSGISRSAGVPTGWEVVLDLIERVALLEGDQPGDDATAWYRAKYGGEPDYSKLLETLAPEPAERSRLLRAYFEPDDEERGEGVKLPTAAHRAVARLVRDGFVRVIVTTNFDRLLEMALQDEGVVPTVVANADAARGVLPFAHTACTIVKIHGDYLDARIRNTTSELAAYEPELDRLLDQVLDEYGLVVCGWSADWDPALSAAIERCSSHRFTTYWATRSDPSEVVARLLQLRRAVVVPISDADAFFVELEEKVAALTRVDAPHPLSPRLGAETVKRYLPDAAQRIRLYDAVSDEAARVEAATADAAFPTSGEPPTQQAMITRLERYESITATLVKMLVVGGYWGEREHNDLWVGTIDRLANRHTELGGLEVWLKLRQYPAVLALYGLGLGAVAAGKLDTLAAVLGRLKVRTYGQERTLAEAIPVADVVSEGLLQPEGQPRHHTPASDRICDLVLREPLREFLPQEHRYEDAFDRFEYLVSLAFADTKPDFWAPAGSFGWRQKRRDDSVYASVEAEARAAGPDWPFLSEGLFQGSLDRFLEVKAGFDAIARRAYW